MGNSKIINLLGGDQVQIDLDINDSIYIKGDAQFLIDNSLTIEYDKKSKKYGGFFGFGGKDVFLNKITNNSNNKASILISPVFPGYIKEIRFKKNQSMVFSSHAILACTANLNISNKEGELVNLMGGSGLAVTEISSPVGIEGGMVWIYSLAGAYSKNLEDPHNYKVYAGLFVGCSSKVFDQIVPFGKSDLSELLTGEGLMMNFEKCVAEGELHLQVANIPAIIHKISTKKYEERMEYYLSTPAVLGTAAVLGAAQGALQSAVEGEGDAAEAVADATGLAAEAGIFVAAVGGTGAAAAAGTGEAAKKEGEEESEVEREEGTEREEGESEEEGTEGEENTEFSQDSEILENSDDSTGSDYSKMSEFSEESERKSPSEWISKSLPESSIESTPEALRNDSSLPDSNSPATSSELNSYSPSVPNSPATSSELNSYSPSVPNIPDRKDYAGGIQGQSARGLATRKSGTPFRRTIKKKNKK